MLQRRLLYAGYGLSTHDQRFISAASEDGWEVFHLRFDGTAISDKRQSSTRGYTEVQWLGTRQPYSEETRGNFVAALSEVCGRLKPTFITGGPLHTVGAVIAESGTTPYLAMSFASDVLFEAQQSRRSALHVRRALSYSTAVIVDCETVKAACLELGAKRQKIIVVPWGVDLDAFPYVPHRNTRSGANLLSLRNHEEVYDLRTLISAYYLALNNDWLPAKTKLVIAGSGTLTEELKSLVDSLGLSAKVSFCGHVSESDLGSLIRDCDIYVSTSLVDGTSVSLLQAMATGRPAIVADIPSNREWVNAKCGWKFRAGSDQSLAATLREGVTSRDRHLIMGAEARKICSERADWLRNYEEISSLYDSFCTRPSPVDHPEAKSSIQSRKFNSKGVNDNQ